MKRLLILCTITGLIGFAFAQGIQSKVKLSGKTTVVVTGHTVTLTWDASSGAASYNIYRSPTHGGPYTKIASGVTDTTYTDVEVTKKQILYYVTTAVGGSHESAYSNEAVVTLP